VILILPFVGFVLAVVLWHVVRRVAAPRVTAAVLVTTGLVAVLGTWMVAPGLFVPSPAAPSGQLVGWELGQGYGGPRFDPATAQSTTMIPMVVDHPACAGADWLGQPAIAYTPWSVTITMSAREPLRNATCSGGWYLSGMYVQVLLSEPLGGRQLFDGSKSPPHPRSAGDPPRSFSG
jgi:hypothetical protein